MDRIRSVSDAERITISDELRLSSANHDEIESGLTTDVYFLRTYDVLRASGRLDTHVTAEIFATRDGVLAGMNDVKKLLADCKVDVWALPQGSQFGTRDVIMRIKGPYGEFGALETAILGTLASSSGWARAAKECKLAAGNKPVVCFGSRHLHPAVAPAMEQSALVGGVDGVSSVLAAKLTGRSATGTMPHALMLIIGDTVKAAQLYHDTMPSSAPRIILVDTFKDEAEESMRVAKALGDDLEAIRLDTPGERGGVTPFLVKEVRARLDLEGFNHVKVFVSGGLNPERIAELSAAGADAFGVGSYISAASPVDMTLDIKEIKGRLVAKRGRIPGLTKGEDLKPLM